VPTMWFPPLRLETALPLLLLQWLPMN